MRKIVLKRVLEISQKLLLPYVFPTMVYEVIHFWDLFQCSYVLQHCPLYVKYIGCRKLSNFMRPDSDLKWIYNVA